MSEEKQPEPKITIRVVDRENFTLGVDIVVPNLDYAINMLEQVLRGVKAQQQDQEAIQFQQKMAQAAQAQRAVSAPRIVKPQ